METGKTFVQVFIKSEEDLPTRDIFSNDVILIFHEKYTDKTRHEEGYSSTWDEYFLKEVDWWLKPVDLVGKEGVMNCIDAEPELPGEMPNEIYDSVQGDKNALTELLRITVRATKQGIKDRIATELSEVKSEQRNKIEELMAKDEKDGMYEGEGVPFDDPENFNPACGKCGHQNSENCNTCDVIEKSEVKESGSVTDEEINKKIFAICSEMRPYDGKTLPKTAPEMLTEFAKWLRSRLQPADNLTDLINCIKVYDKTAPLEEKGRYFEAIQRELEKIQPAVTDEQIEKWAEIASTRKEWDGFPTINLIAKRLRIEGAKAMRDGKIAEYIKNLK